MWRLVLAQIATLQEIETHWSLLDLLDGNEALDLKELAEYKAQERAKRR